MAYEDILDGDALLDSLDVLKARDDAIRTCHAGPSAPSLTSAYIVWIDTSTGLIKRRNAANDGWRTIGKVDEDYDGLMYQLAPVLQADMDAGSFRITDLADPTGGADAVPRDWARENLAGTYFFGSSAIGKQTLGDQLLRFSDLSTASLVRVNVGFTVVNDGDGEPVIIQPTNTGIYRVSFSVQAGTTSATLAAAFRRVSGTPADLFKCAEAAGTIPVNLAKSAILELEAGVSYSVRLTGSSPQINGSDHLDNDLSINYLGPSP